MNSIKFKQFKNPKSNYLGIGFILFGIVASIENLIIGLTVFLLGIIFLGLNFEIEIFKNFKNRLNVNLFNIKIFSFKKEILYPDYISLFGQSYSHSNDFSTVSSLGSSSSFDFYVIRFFDENNRNEIVFKSKNSDEVLIKGSELSILLDVELVNKIEE
ncbi:hypothetical protein [Pseudofulvibacter geojedonensis]|uniref:Uncharacterized protein n=1 Tax=Pseudofulvibacter geojedonensis TaxID=1123758 RepID=A0ABW3I4T3_9FLAO